MKFHNFHSLRVRFFALAMTTIVLILLTTETTLALPAQQNMARQGIAATCTALDVAVIVDQSTSMQTNDRQNLRIDAVRNLIDVLYENAAIRCTGITHRIGVVSFGGTAETMVDFEQGVIHVADADDDWETPRNHLKTLVMPRDLGNTAFWNAFELAQGLFATPAGTADGLRARAIILVTDGAPCTETALNMRLAIGTAYCQSSTYAQHYFEPNAQTEFYFGDNDYLEEGFDTPNGLRSALNSSVTANTSLNVLMFNTREDTEPTWSQVNDSWTRITGEHHGVYIRPDDSRLRSQRQIAVILDEIIAPLIGSVRNVIPIERDENGQCSAPFYLEPYLSATTFIAATRPANENLRIQIIDPNGNQIPAQDTTLGDMRIQYNTGASLERYTLTNPLPGEWKVIDPTGQECELVDAYYEPIQVNNQLTDVTPITPNIVAPYTEGGGRGTGTVQLYLTRSDDPFSGIPGYPLEISGRVQFLNSARTEVQAKLDELEDIRFTPELNNPGTWVSDPLPAPARGSYLLTITATAQAVSPTSQVSRNQIFETSLQYTTTDPIALEFRIIAPVETDTLPLNEIDVAGVQSDLPFNVQVEFIADNQNQPIDRIFPEGIDNLVQATLRGVGTTTENRAINRPIFLDRDTENPNLLVGQFSTPSGLPDPEGQYEVVVSVTANGQLAYNHENYTLTTLPQSVQFQRSDLEGMKLVSLSPEAGQTLLLNTIVSDAQVSEPVEVSVQLVNQANQPLPVHDVFSGDLGQLVRAFLLDPNERVVGQPIWLTQSTTSNSTFVGTFPSQGNNIGQEGTYTITFEFGSETISPQYDDTEHTFLSPRADDIRFERVERRGIVPVALQVINPVGANNSEANPLLFETNSINGEGAQVSNTIYVTAALADLDSTLLTNLELEEILLPEAVDVMMATIEGPPQSNIRETIELIRQDNGAFRGELHLANEAIAPEGIYTVSFRVNPSAFVTSGSAALATYELVRQQTEPVYLEGYQRFGVRLILNSMTGQSVVGTPETLRLPLYNTWLDAWNRTIAPVPFELVIVNTVSDESLAWETITRIENMPASTLTNAPVDGEATQEPQLMEDATNAMTSLGIADVIRVAIQPMVRDENGNLVPNGNPVPITRLQQVQSNGITVIRGEINEAIDTADYALSYGIVDNNINRVIYTNFSDHTAPNRVSFVRAIDYFWLNPNFWDVIKPILVVLAAVYIIWFMLINFGLFSMRGKMTVNLKTPTGNVTEEIPLGGRPRLWRRSRKGKKTKVTVTRASSNTPSTATIRGAIGAPPTQPKGKASKPRKYRVRQEGGGDPIVVEANGEGGPPIFRVKHNGD